ncbi:MAG: hypothetical protein H6811_10440 [Phycisphaeraceae bacterium]|nr:hypothetical protein [Phycisphaeraceae bacterium]
MLLDRSESVIVAAESWLDGAAICKWDVRSLLPTNYRVPDATDIRVTDVDGERFLAAVVREADPALEVSIRSFSDPGTSKWTLSASDRGVEITGDAAACRGIPRIHATTLPRVGPCLLSIDPEGSQAKLIPLTYRGVLGAVELSGTAGVVVAMNEPPSLVELHLGRDLAQGRVQSSSSYVSELSRLEDQIWVVTGDTVLRLDARTVLPLGLIDLRADRERPTWHSRSEHDRFAGSLFRARDGRVAVPRPHSGDVAIVAPPYDAIGKTIRTGGEPIRCVMTREGRVLARDWMSGDWLEKSG